MCARFVETSNTQIEKVLEHTTLCHGLFTDSDVTRWPAARSEQRETSTHFWQNNRDNHAAYQRLQDDYANFVRSKHKSAGKKRSKSAVRASNPATESPHPDAESIKTTAGRSEQCKMIVNDEEVARERQASIARLNEASREYARLEAAHSEPQDQTLHQSSGVTGKSVAAHKIRSCKTELLISDQSLTGSKRRWSTTTGQVGNSVRSLTGRYGYYRVVTDGHIRALNDASSGLVSLDRLSDHDEKHDENNAISSDGHIITYEDLNTSQ